MENEFYTYLDNVTIDGETKWYTEPPFDVYKEVAGASDEIISSVFKKINFKMTDEEAKSLIGIIRQYAKNKEINPFDKLPSKVQSRIKSLQSKLNKNSKDGTSIDTIAKMMLEQIINDISMDVIFAKLEQEQSAMAKEQYERSDAIFNDIFNQKDELEAETPGVKKNIEAVKNAFIAASTFDAQITYLQNDIPHSVKRYHQHYNSEVSEFNKKCSESKFSLIGIKDYLLDTIKNNLPTQKKYTTDEIKAFIVLVIRTLQDLDFDDLEAAAYIHRLLDRIYRQKYVSTNDAATFDDISKVIDQYRNIIQLTSNTKKKKK